MKQSAGNALGRRFDARHETRSAIDAAPLKSYLGRLNIEEVQSNIDAEQRRWLDALCERYLKHEFNLLGSGWVNVRHGMECTGLNGHRYGPHESASVDPQGDWLAGRVNAANRPRSQTIWQLVDADYTPIDWQLDFKSGYRWNEATWYRDIPLGHLPGVDIKVPWELARMQHLPQMALTCCLPGANRSQLAREFRNQVLDFMATNPPRFGVNWNCAMDVGIRVANWLLARDMFIAAGCEFDDDFEREFLAAVHDHAEHIAANLEWSAAFRGNHYLADIAGLLFASAYLPCTEISNAWLAFATRQLVVEVDNQFLPDGGNFEASTCYHRLSAEMVVWCTAIVAGLDDEKRAALADYDHSQLKTTPRLEPAPVPTYRHGDTAESTPFPPWYWDRLEQMTEIVLHTTKPNGRLHQVGDNDSGRFFNVLPVMRSPAGDANPADTEPCEDQLDPRSLVAAANGLFGRNDFQQFCGSHAIDSTIVAAFTQSAGLTFTTTSSHQEAGSTLNTVLQKSVGAKPSASFSITLPCDVSLSEAACHAWPDFGLFIWRTPRCYFAVRCGPIGQNGIGGHAHNDQLAVELQVDGIDWIADPGTYLYTPDPAARNRYRSVAAHCAPRLEDNREPGLLDRGLFRIDGTAAGECLYVGRDGFIGRHAGYGPAVTRVVRIEGSRIRIDDYAEGDLSLQPVTDVSIENRPKPTVPFSDGYGLSCSKSSFSS